MDSETGKSEWTKIHERKNNRQGQHAIWDELITQQNITRANKGKKLEKADRDFARKNIT